MVLAFLADSPIRRLTGSFSFFVYLFCYFFAVFVVKALAFLRLSAPPREGFVAVSPFHRFTVSPVRGFACFFREQTDLPHGPPMILSDEAS